MTPLTKNVTWLYLKFADALHPVITHNKGLRGLWAYLLEFPDLQFLDKCNSPCLNCLENKKSPVHYTYSDFRTKVHSTCYLSTVTPVLSGHPLGMAYWPLNTVWPFNIGLTNLRVIQENEGSQRVKYMSHDKLTSICFYLFLGQKKKVKDHLTPYTVWPVVLVWYVFQGCQK